MTNILISGGVLLFVVFIAFSFHKRPFARLMRAVEESKKSKDIAPIVAVITDTNRLSDATSWDAAINALWQSHSRENAAALIVVAIHHCDEDILHYWAGKVLEIEPDIVMTHFSEDFLQNVYRPSAAASCGACGCGSGSCG